MSTATAPVFHPAFAGVGIELEYMIVDSQGLDARPIADELLRAEAGQPASDVVRGDMGWSNELARHVMEIKNPLPRPRLTDLAPAFQAEVRAANAALAPMGGSLMPGGMHPWFDPRRDAVLWSGEKSELYQAYDRIFDCRRHGWVNIQSMHVNLPFGNDLEFARLHAAVRLVLPILPALAASSPFAEGRYTGSLDYRLEVYRTHQDRVPATQGEVIPDDSASPADYAAKVLYPMYQAIAPFDPAGLLQHEWLNARAAIPRFDRQAIEIRVLDVQECPLADLAIAAAAIALIRRFFEAGAKWLAREGQIATAALKNIFMACSRDADAATIDDAGYLAILGLPERPCRARDVWARLVDELSADGSLEAEWHAPLRHILDYGPLARRLVLAAGPEPSRSRLRAIYRELCRCLQDGRMYQA